MAELGHNCGVFTANQFYFVRIRLQLMVSPIPLIVFQFRVVAGILNLVFIKLLGTPNLLFLIYALLNAAQSLVKIISTSKFGDMSGKLKLFKG